MSKIADKVFERLRNGEPPGEIRSSVGSASRFAEGLQKYVAWASIEIERLQKEVTKEDTKHQELIGINKTFARQNENLEKDFERLKEDEEKLSSQMETLMEKEERTREITKKLEEQAKQLREKEYTEDIMLLLSESDATGGKEMLQRVQTIEKYETEKIGLAKVVEKLKDDKERLPQQIKILEDKVLDLHRLEDDASERLRIAHEEAQLFEDSVKTTGTLMKRYNLRDSDFKNLMVLVTRAGTPRMSGQTIERAKLLLDNYHTLTKLEAELKGRSETLSKLNSDINKAEARLAASTEAYETQSEKIGQFVKNIQAIVEKSTERIASTLTGIEASASTDFEKSARKITESATSSLKSTQNNASQSIKELLTQSRQVLGDIESTNKKLAEQLETLTKSTYTDFGEQSKKTLKEIQDTSREMSTQHKAQLDEWGRIQAEAGRLAPEIRRANTLLGFENYEDGLSLLDRSEIELLISRITEWSKTKKWTKRPSTQFRNLTSRIDIGVFGTLDFEEALNWAQLLLKFGK